MQRDFSSGCSEEEKNDIIHQSMLGTSYLQCLRETAQIWFKEKDIIVEKVSLHFKNTLKATFLINYKSIVLYKKKEGK